MKLDAISYSIISFVKQTSNHNLSYAHFDKHQNFWNPEPSFCKIIQNNYPKLLNKKIIQKINKITVRIAHKKRFFCGTVMTYEKDVIMLLI